MNLAFSEEQSPFRIRFEQPVTGDELERFCAEKDPLRIELDSNGELIVMTPTNSEGGGVETDVTLERYLGALGRTGKGLWVDRRIHASRQFCESGRCGLGKLAALECAHSEAAKELCPDMSRSRHRDSF